MRVPMPASLRKASTDDYLMVFDDMSADNWLVRFQPSEANEDENAGANVVERGGVVYRGLLEEMIRETLDGVYITMDMTVVVGRKGDGEMG